MDKCLTFHLDNGKWKIKAFLLFLKEKTDNTRKKKNKSLHHCKINAYIHRSA